MKYPWWYCYTTVQHRIVFENITFFCSSTNYPWWYCYTTLQIHSVFESITFFCSSANYPWWCCYTTVQLRSVLEGINFRPLSINILQWYFCLLPSVQCPAPTMLMCSHTHICFMISYCSLNCYNVSSAKLNPPVQFYIASSVELLQWFTAISYCRVNWSTVVLQ